jgi:multicomponent Na+:H+ antiporter subunit D
MALAPLPVAIPLLAAAFAAATRLFIPGRWINRIAIATSVVTAAVCCVLTAQSMEGRIVYWFGGWEPRDGVALGIAFVIDPFGAGLASLTALLVTAAFLFSSTYFDDVRALYHVLMLAFLGGMCGFSLTGDLFNLFVFFELMSVAAFALCAYKTEEPGPLQGAINFAVTNTVGAFLALSGIGLLYGRTGALNMAQVSRGLDAHPADALAVVAFLLITSGFLVKAAAAPFHFWLADAHAVSPTPVCVLFSGVMVQLGLYAAMRVYWTVFAGPLAGMEGGLRNVLVGAGLLTALLGGVMCFVQRNLKRLLAFSTVSHMGLMLIGFGLLEKAALGGTAAYIVGHGFVKGALFLGCGILLHRFRTIDELDLRGRGRAGSPALAVTGLLFALSALGLTGLPPFGTYLGDLLIEHSAAKLGYGWLSVVFVAAEILTGGAVLRAAGRVFLGWGSAPGAEADERGRVEEGPETQGGHQRIPAVMIVPAVALAIAGLASGFVPGARHTAEVAAAYLHDGAGHQLAVLEATASAPTLPEPPVPSLIPMVRGFSAAGGAVLLALASLFRRGLSGSSRLPGRTVLARSIDGLRTLHSGAAGDYVAWLTAGVAGFDVFFLLLL